MATIPSLNPRPAKYLHAAMITGVNHYEMETSVQVERLYAEQRDVVFRVALRVTRNAADAEDVVQNVFLRMLRNAAQPDPARSPGAYLRRAAANAAIDLIRQRSQRSETTIPQHQPAAEDAEAAWVERRHVRQVIGQLPPRHAQLVELHYRDGYMCHEVAELMDMHCGTVKSRLHRIRAVLFKELRAA